MRERTHTKFKKRPADGQGVARHMNPSSWVFRCIAVTTSLEFISIVVVRHVYHHDGLSTHSIALFEKATMLTTTLELSTR
jgi:hypothetical protein